MARRGAQDDKNVMDDASMGDKLDSTTLNLLISQVKGLQAQFAVLRAQLERPRGSEPPKSLGDLYGILAGRSDSSEEEINAVLYRFDWEGESSDDMKA
jgi:hypothetical protein